MKKKIGIKEYLLRVEMMFIIQARNTSRSKVWIVYEL